MIKYNIYLYQQPIYEPPSSFKHQPLAATAGIGVDVDTAGRRCISPTHPWLATRKGNLCDTDVAAQMLGLNWLNALQDKIDQLLKGEPDNQQVCDLIEVSLLSQIIWLQSSW